MTVKTRQQSATRPAKAISPRHALKAQAVAVLICTAAGAMFGRHTALSVLFIGVLCVTANGIAACLMFRTTRPQAAKKILFNFCCAEIVKLTLAVGGITATAVLWPNVNPIRCLAVYALLQLTWLPAICALAVLPRLTWRRRIDEGGHKA